ncbi:MAG: CRTAC1 family protein [Pseudomonadota bacterium]
MNDPGKRPSKAPIWDSLNEESEEQDDAIIGVYLRRSLWVFAGLAFIGAAIYAWQQRDRGEVEVIETNAPAAAAVAAVTIDAPSIPFTDMTADAGIQFVHNNGAYGEKLLPETMGGGVALFDYNNDGLVDIFFVNSTAWPTQIDAPATTHALYRNRGNWRFENVTAEVGLALSDYGMGVAVGDYNGDGYEDLYVTAVGSNRLLRNRGGKRFTEESLGVEGGLDEWSTSAAFFDMDNDGDLDLFSTNYVVWSRDIDFEVDYQLTGIGRAYGPPTNYRGTQSRLWRNDGDTFVDVSERIHVTNPATDNPVGKGLAVRPMDINRDGRLDLVVANDTVQNFVFVNQGEGRFDEQGAVMGMAFDNSGNATGAMGVDAAYYQNSDDVAIVIGNFANEMSSFYVSRGSDVFTDESIVSGIGPDSRRALSFGLQFFDADLDGRTDLLTANGHVEDDINTVQPSQRHAQPAQLFWNCGPTCRRTYTRIADDQLGAFSTPIVGRGAAAADLDNDGDQDVVLTQTGAPPLVLRNDQSTGDFWIRIALQQPGDNPRAIGASVTLTAGDSVQRQTIMPARSYLSQVPADVTFGLGTAREARVSVTWPDGKIMNYNNLEINRAHTLRR